MSVLSYKENNSLYWTQFCQDYQIYLYVKIQANKSLKIIKNVQGFVETRVIQGNFNLEYFFT